MLSFLYFNQTERRGAFLFFSIIALACILPSLYRGFWRKPAEISINIQTLDTIPTAPKAAIVAEAASPDSLFPFNPAEASKETLMALGLSERVANTLINYRKKGGRFFRKEDLKKIYGIEESWYQQVEMYIVLPERAPKPSYVYRKAKNYSPPPPVQVAINTANAETWAQLRGIGPVLSDRIVKFREKLGGFNSVEQVAETYGLPDSTFQSIRSQLQLKTSPRKLSINLLGTEELAQHPYITWKLARILVNYRTLHGPFTQKSDLEQVYTLEANTLARLEPYLDFCTDCPSPPKSPTTDKED